jgi:hypothetical protein
MDWAVPCNQPAWAGFAETHRMMEALLERRLSLLVTQPNRMENLVGFRTTQEIEGVR